MPLEAPVMRTSFAAMRDVFPTYQANVTAAAFPLTSLPEFCVLKVCPDCGTKATGGGEPLTGVVEVLPKGSRRYILSALILMRRGSLHEVVFVRPGLRLGRGGTLRDCSCAGQGGRLQQIDRHRGWL